MLSDKMCCNTHPILHTPATSLTHGGMSPIIIVLHHFVHSAPILPNESSQPGVTIWGYRKQWWWYHQQLGQWLLCSAAVPRNLSHVAPNKHMEFLLCKRKHLPHYHHSSLVCCNAVTWYYRGSRNWYLTWVCCLYSEVCCVRQKPGVYIQPSLVLARPVYNEQLHTALYTQWDT